MKIKKSVKKKIQKQFWILNYNTDFSNQIFKNPDDDGQLETSNSVNEKSNFEHPILR